MKMQQFRLPEEFINEIIEKIEGIPADAKHIGSGIVTLDSVEFNSNGNTLDVIRTRTGWKVEGT